MTPDVVAIDRGGSALRLYAARQGRVVVRWEGPSRPLDALKDWLVQFWRSRGWDRPHRLIVGSKGVWTAGERRRWARRWAPFARRVTVLSDAELGYHAALGRRPGVYLIAGTGSMALARDGNGRWRRAGGLGPGRGDEGSGWWVGKEYLRRTGRRAPRVLSPTVVRRVAARAEKILQSTSRTAVDLQRDAARRLAALVQSLGLDRRNPVVFGGSLFNNRAFRRRVAREIAANGGGTGRRAPENPARTAVLRPGQFPAAGPWPRRGARK